MGQWDVHDFLKRNKRKWFSTRELSGRLAISRGCVVASCKRLRKANMVYIRHRKPVCAGRMVPLYGFRK